MYNFQGLIKAQQTAFEGTPGESDLQNDDRVQWVDKTTRKSVSVVS